MLADVLFLVYFRFFERDAEIMRSGISKIMSHILIPTIILPCDSTPKEANFPSSDTLMVWDLCCVVRRGARDCESRTDSYIDTYVGNAPRTQFQHTTKKCLKAGRDLPDL